MRLIIDVPEEYYKAIKEISDELSTTDMLIIKYGIPLSKKENCIPVELLQEIRQEIEKLQNANPSY